MAEIVDATKTFVITLTSPSAPPPPPPTIGGDPSSSPTPKSLAAGDHNIEVRKSGFETVYAKINVSSGGLVSCKSVTGGSCGGTGYPRVEAPGTTSSVKVYMATGIPSDGLCDWIVSRGGWRSISWAHVLDIYDAYLDPSKYSVGFDVVWEDVMTAYDYYLDQPSGQPTLGNASAHGCGFT